jgi:hypothetical protein
MLKNMKKRCGISARFILLSMAPISVNTGEGFSDLSCGVAMYGAGGSYSGLNFQVVGNSNFFAINEI